MNRPEEDLLEVMKTETGRRLLARIIYEQAQVEGRVFTESATTTAFLEGRRSLGVELLADIRNFDPRGYNVMIQERMNAFVLLKEQKDVRRKQRDSDFDFD